MREMGYEFAASNLVDAGMEHAGIENL
jgi:hypothetical protein